MKNRANSQSLAKIAKQRQEKEGTTKGTETTKNHFAPFELFVVSSLPILNWRPRRLPPLLPLVPSWQLTQGLEEVELMVMERVVNI